MLKLCFVTTEFISEPSFTGGLANYLARITQLLTAAGHEVHIVVEANEDATFDYQGVKVHRVKVEHQQSSHFPRGFFALTVAERLGQRLLELQAQIGFSLVQYSSFRALGLARIKGLPSVVRVSSFEPEYRLRTGIPADNIDYQIGFDLEKLAMKVADGVFSPSKLTQKFLHERWGVDSEVIRSPFFLETKRLDDSIIKTKLAGRKYFLFFGRLNRLKGIATISQMLTPLLSKHKDYSFVFAGVDDYWEQLQAENSSVLSQLIYLGPLPHVQLYPLIKHAELVILPSLLENFPNACLEAMGLGKVVVGTADSSMEELITAGKSGFLAKAGDAASLLAEVEKYLALSKLAKARLKLGVRRDIKLVAPAPILKLHLAYYQKIIKECSS